MYPLRIKKKNSNRTKKDSRERERERFSEFKNDKTEEAINLQLRDLDLSFLYISVSLYPLLVRKRNKQYIRENKKDNIERESLVSLRIIKLKKL